MNRASVKGESSLRAGLSANALLWAGLAVLANHRMPDTFKLQDEHEHAISPNYYV